MGRLLDADGTRICMVHSDNEEANARRIVQAVNTHADLLAAAQAALDFMPQGQPETRRLREAIAKHSSPKAQP